MKPDAQNIPAQAAQSGPTLNQELRRLGLTKLPSRHGRFDIYRGDSVVLADASASDTWDWLDAGMPVGVPA